LPVSAFPVPGDELAYVKRVVREVTGRCTTAAGLKAEVFVQMAQLHVGDGAARLAAHGREWRPTLGLGVWPNRAPPTLWTRKDFENLGPGEAPRKIMYQVFRITGPDAGGAAREEMLGLGTLLQLMFEGSFELLLERMGLVLLAPIKEPAYTCFPFYVPLLDVDAVAGASAELLERWCGGAQIYVRESAEDVGILLVSQISVRSILQSLGVLPTTAAS
jgi:hypothetical protein